MLTRAFVLERKCTYAWGRGEQAVFSGSTGPEKHFSGTGPVHIFCLGAQAVIR